MASGRQARLALTLLAVAAATVSMPLSANAAISAGPLSSYTLATVRGVAGHWIATIKGVCTEMILTPQGRLTQVRFAWFGGAALTRHSLRHLCKCTHGVRRLLSVHARAMGTSSLRCVSMW